MNATPEQMSGEANVRHQKERNDFMPVIARFCGIVIRLLCLRTLGTRLHAFHGNSEMIVDLASLRIIEGNVPARESRMVMAWAKMHQRELLAGLWRLTPGRATWSGAGAS